MRKKIALITGASGGIGSEFARKLIEENIDEIWAVARNVNKLGALQKELGGKIREVPKDLTNAEDLCALQHMLDTESPLIMFFINNAGMGKMGLYHDFSIDEIQNTILLNCSGFAVLCQMCIPFMEKGSRILNISSASSFQPLPYLNLYASCKVFVRNYSRALNVELKSSGITATAVCPSWVDTDMLKKEVNGKPVHFKGIVSAEQVVTLALRDAKRGKDMSVCSMYVKFLHVLSKFVPQRMYMNMWLQQIKEYVS